MNGQVPAETTYKEFISRQSFSDQSEALGRNRALLLRDTDITIDDLYGRDRLLLGRELRARFPEQYASVFGE